VTPQADAWRISADHVYQRTGRYGAVLRTRNARSGIAYEFAFNVQVGPAGKRTIRPAFAWRVGTRFDGTVAAFRVPGVHRIVKDYAATIAWGDGTTSKGTVTFARGRFAVAGRHTYRRAAAERRVRITVKDSRTGATLIVQRPLRLRA
jgi:hypothetical protein